MSHRIVPPLPAQLLTVDQVAKHLRVGTGAATRLITSGPLPGRYLDGELVVDRKDLERFVRSAA